MTSDMNNLTPCGVRRQDVRVPSKELLRSSGQVQSLSRALKLLNALSYHPQGLSLSELAREVGLPNSTAHRLLTTLQNEQYKRHHIDQPQQRRTELLFEHRF